MGGLDDTVGKFGLSSALAFGAATAALGSFARVGLGELMEAEAVLAQTNATLKSTGGISGVTAAHVGELSNRFSELAAVDDEVVQGGANILLTFTNIRNSGVDAVFDRALEATLNLSRALHKDLQSSAIMVGKALNDPIRGVTALRKAGVQLTIQQEIAIEKFIKVGDVASAQEVILKELETQVGGSAAAYGDTLAGSLDSAKIKFENLAGTIMGKVMDAGRSWLDQLGDIKDRVDEINGTDDDSRREFSPIGWLWDQATREIDLDPNGEVEKLTSAASVMAAVFRDRVAPGFKVATLSTKENTEAIAEANRAYSSMGGPAAPKSGIGRSIITDIGAVQDAWDRVTDAANEADRAMFDALSEASPERMQRNLALQQAEFNSGVIQQQIDAGRGSMGAPGFPGMSYQEAFDWINSVFIPGQEKWLSIDQDRIERDEAAAVLAKELTGDYKNVDAAIRGNLTPGFDQLGEAMYDVQDATHGTRTAFRELDAESPVDLAVNSTFDVPTVAEVRASLRDLIRDFNANLPPWLRIPLPAEPSEAQVRASLQQLIRDFNDNLPPWLRIPLPAKPS
ncbi:MAG: hypothetical protein Q8Q14_06125, partial [Gemmatimonadales bacterium]|nr:hypothetical protein [Gemmatimonadales bacterium]